MIFGVFVGASRCVGVSVERRRLSIVGVVDVRGVCGPELV